VIVSGRCPRSSSTRTSTPGHDGCTIPKDRCWPCAAPLPSSPACCLIASLLPPETAEAIRQIIGNNELLTLDEGLQPVANPELPEIARALPAGTAYQIIRTAERLGVTDYSDVLTEVANAVTREAARPKGGPHSAAPHLAGKSFPHPPPTIQFGTEPATARSGSPRTRPKLPRTKRRSVS
jgi:hypothetical protein